MSTPSCRDALSREISEPVVDPFTGICYRNPCAAEEAGVPDWAPGCVLAQPVYPSGPDLWASEIWWSGDEHGGGGDHHRPNWPNGRRGGQGKPGGRRRISSGSGQAGGQRAVPSTKFSVYGGGQYATPMRPAAPMFAVNRPRAGRARGMKGLGQATSVPTATGNLAAALGRAVAMVAGGGLVMVASPIVIGSIVGLRTKSWGRALIAGAATVAVEGALFGGYIEYRRRTRVEPAALTIPTIAYIR
jgi:hypothetical protein